jgi:hypothetical protein
VLEQLLSDLEDGIPENSFSQNDTIAKSWLKFSCKTGTSLTVKEQENLVNGLLPVKIPMFFPKNLPHYHAGRRFRYLHYEKYNRNGKAVINYKRIVLYRDSGVGDQAYEISPILP